MCELRWRKRLDEEEEPASAEEDDCTPLLELPVPLLPVLLREVPLLLLLPLLLDPTDD